MFLQILQAIQRLLYSHRALNSGTIAKNFNKQTQFCGSRLRVDSLLQKPTWFCQRLRYLTCCSFNVSLFAKDLITSVY
jgi:hypothetical protein